MGAKDDILGTRSEERKPTVTATAGNGSDGASDVTTATDVVSTAPNDVTAQTGNAGGTANLMADNSTATPTTATPTTVTTGSKPVVSTTRKRTTTTQTEELVPATDQKPRMSYVELYEAMNPHKPETPEERAKREKKERREANLSAIGDGISALANLYHTTRYSPNAYDASKGLSPKAKERWERLRKEREANDKAYFDGYLRAMQMDDAKDREDRNWRHTLEREEIADARYEIKAAQEKELADLNAKLKDRQITAAEADAEAKKIKAKYAEQTEELNQENIRAGIRQKDAAAGASRAKATESYAKAEAAKNGGGGKSKTPHTLELEDEKLNFGDNKDEYEKAVLRYAEAYNVPIEKIEVTERNFRGEPKKQRTVKRSVREIAGEIEREAAKRKAAKKQNQTMPGVGGGNNNGNSTTMPGVK